MKTVPTSFRACRNNSCRRPGFENVERQKHAPVLDRALDRLGVLRLVRRHEQVERLLGLLPALGLVDVVEHPLRLRLRALGQLVEHVGRLVHHPGAIAEWRATLVIPFVPPPHPGRGTTSASQPT